MGLNANALVTLPEAKLYLAHQGSAEDPQIETAINRASDYAEGPNGANRLLKERVWAGRLPAARGCHLYAPIAPIKASASISVTVSGVAQTVWKTTADDPRTGKGVIVVSSIPDRRWTPDQFYRVAGWECYSDDPEPIELSFTGGFTAATLPQDLLDAFLQVLGKFFRDEMQQNPDTISYSGPGGTVTRADTEIPRRAKQILGSYRRVMV